MRTVFLVVTLILASALSVGAESTRTRIDVSKLGPQVGERVPDFTLFDQNGKQQTLQSITGRRGTMLVFIRSADWCPYCKTQLIELQSRVKDLEGKGIGLATISYDSRDVLAVFARQHDITFPMLSDPDSATIKRFGILNTVAYEAFGPNKDDPAVKADVQRYISVVNPTPSMQGIAFPGTFMLDRQGRVTSRFFQDFYVERNTVASVMKRLGLGGQQVAATTISTQHLDVTTYPTETTIAAGNRFSLVLEITPKRGMHVYAPGASSYRVVSVKIDGQPAVRALPPEYPRSDIHVQAPERARRRLSEAVHAHSRPGAGR